MDADTIERLQAAVHAASAGVMESAQRAVTAASDLQPHVVAIALLTLLLALLLTRLMLSKTAPARDCLLLVGASGAGKTALFSRLQDSSCFAGTTPSMAENVAQLALGHSRKTLRVVDLPGHPRLRSRLDSYARSAAALVFVVDGREGAFLPSVRDVAQVFLDVLTHAALAKRPPPLLLAVNKTDKSGCHSVDFVRKRVEKEIDALRSARGTLEDTGGEGDAAQASAVLQCPQPFSFAGAGIGLTCGGISVLRNDLSALNCFVNTLR